MNVCMYNVSQTYIHLPLAWEGTSVWDLPIDTIPQPSIEQIQLEKAKAAKVCQPILVFSI